MTHLLGFELRGQDVWLTVVKRNGRLGGTAREPLDGPMSEWWSTHPDEKVRAVRSLMDRASRDGLFTGASIASIGLTGESGLVLLDPDFAPIPPRTLPWEDLAEMKEAHPIDALRALIAREPRFARTIGVVLSTVDYIRFRLTGALATRDALLELASG